MSKQGIERPRAVTTRVMEGKPMRVGECELTPVVRVTTHAWRQAFVGADRLAATGRCFVSMQPVAMMERSAAGERRISIPDRTAQLLGGLLLAAFVIPLLLAVAVRLARKS